MKFAIKKFLFIIVSFTLSMSIVAPVSAAGLCSPYLGFATINEIFKDKANQANDADDFVELKLLDQSIPLATYSQWSIQACENDAAGNNNDNDGCSARISLSAFTDLSPAWLVLKDGTIGSFINFKTGFDVILLDANDDVIDYLSVDGHTQLEQAGCTGASLPYDYQAGAPGASDKFIFRSPDGTGEWGNAQTASENPTEDSPNDSDPSVPNLTFSEPIIAQGTTTASVTLTLDFASADIINVDFYTFDGSLITITDYTELITTRSIAAGQTSVTIDVPVSASSNIGDFYFFVNINPSSPGLATIFSHVGKITVIGVALNHFNISPATTSASTCVANAITIIAADSSNAPLTGYTGQVNITVSTSHGNWSVNTADNVTNPNPDNDDNGQVNYSFLVSDAGVIILDLSDTHAEVLTITVADTATAISSTSVAISYNSNIFVINEDPIQVAGRPQAMTVEMWTDDLLGSGSCGIDTNYNAANQSIEASIDRAGILITALDPTIGGFTIPDNPATATLSLNFSLLPGQASFSLDTTDVGQYRLILSDITLAHADTVITGIGAQLTVRPFGLAITSIETGPGPTPNPGGFMPGDMIFTTAGADFSATVSAVLWSAADDTDDDGVLDTGFYSDNITAPGYAWDTTLSVDITGGYTPNPGTPGAINNNLVSLAQFGAGFAIVNNLQYSEVGSFTLLANADNFLGEPSADLISDGDIVGRFVPAMFAVSLPGAANGLLGEACIAFTYIGQEFSYDTPPTFTVTAQNLAGVTTAQYRDGFAKLNAGSISVDVSEDSTTMGTDANPLLISYTAAAMIPTVQNDGTVDYVFGADVFRYGPDLPLTTFAKFPNSQVDEFTADIEPEITSITDGEVTTSYAAGTHLVDPEGNLLRFARLRMVNVHGSELDPLLMPSYVEYWDAGSWQKSIADACTMIADADLVAVASPPGLSIPTVVNPLAMAGDIDYSFPAPGSGNDGFVDTTTDLSSAAHLWLRYDWDDDGNFDNDPGARATFGIYGGNSVQIFIQQTFEQ